MVQISAKKTVNVDVKVLKLHCKVRDNFTGSLVDSEGQKVKEWDQDYVPGIMPGEHYGDYIILDIDIETGVILNWKKPIAGVIEQCVNSDKD